MPDSTGQKTDSRVEDLKKLYKQLKEPKEKLMPDWYLNVAYLNGDQWVFWNHGRIDRPQLEDWRITLVDNRMLPAVYARLARKVKTRPVFVVTPNSYAESDLAAAEIGGKVLEDDWEALSCQSKLFDALMWAEVCCAGFWKIYWDSTKGDGSNEYVLDPEGKPFNGPDGRPLKADSQEGQTVLGVEGFTSKAIALGDCAIDVVSPFNLHTDPLVTEPNLDDCEIIIEEHIRSVEYVQKHYNVDVEPDSDVPTGLAESRMFPTGTDSGGSNGYKGVTVYESYGRPGSTYGASGKRCVWTKNQQLEEVTLDQSPFSGNPYVMFPGIKVPGSFWGTSMATQLRGPQTELNKMQSQLRENAIRFGNPSLAMSREANVSYSGLPGEKLYYSSTTPDAIPQFLQPPEMPAYVQNEVERIQTSISEISGLREVSKATVPPGVTAASAINLLLEAGETNLAPEIMDMEFALGGAGTKLLKLRAKWQSDERLIQSAGEDGDWDIRSYRGAMSKENTNVEVQAGSKMPKSQAAKQASMTELFQTMLQYGVEFNPRDIRKFLREYGVGGLDSMFAGLSADEMQIKREHQIMKSGEALDINEFDDDELHIQGHRELQKTRIYWNSPDNIKKIIDVHVNAHVERKQAAIDAQVAEQQRAMLTMNGGGATTQGVQ